MQFFFGQLVRLQKFVNTAKWRPWLRYMLPGLVALVWLGMPTAARASCGYYVVIGHPSGQTAAEQTMLPHERMPLGQKKTCNGPQCRQQNRPMTPAPGVSVSLQDPMAVKLADRVSVEIDLSFASLDDCLFTSEPHIWRSDPPPRF
jgi:hypothetical protein